MKIRTLLSRLSSLITGGILLLMLSGGVGLSTAVRAQSAGEAKLRRFDFITATSGWILLDQQVFWTANSGRTWAEITPEISSGASIETIDFWDVNTGRVLWSTPSPDGSSFFHLSHTVDGGVTWLTRPLSFFEAGDPASFVEKAQMDWFDSQTGWVSLKQATGSNFSLGTLFTTSDGGASWTRSILPVADQVRFVDAGVGWAGGGPSGDGLFETQDGGSTWRDVSPAHPAQSIFTTYLPFYSNGERVLVASQLSSDNYLNVYKAQSGHWSLLDQVELNIQPGNIALSILDGQNFLALIPGTRSIVQMKNGEVRSYESADALSASIVELDMLTLEVGWAKSISSDCSAASALDRKPDSVSCASSARLLYTLNGGVTWETVRFPVVETVESVPEFLGSASVIAPDTRTAGLGSSQVFIGQGFDKCELPTISQLQKWWGNSPYQTVNLYIGGSNRACDNLPLSATHLKTIYEQGWKFIPTWVGPQAPCTGYLYRFSSDPTMAYAEGVAEADLAVERLAELGLTYPDKSGSVIYYDMENYGTGTSCRNAVNAFMNGWVSQIRDRGNLAGVYGSTLCNTGLSDFSTITNVPDVIWPARWYHNLGQGYYNPEASVWNLGSCLPNTIWADHQRIRQYEGDHYETWGNLTLGIDINVLDGVVAAPYLVPFVSHVTRLDTNPSILEAVTFKVQFSAPVTGVDVSDFVLVTTGVVGASIESITGSGQAYMVVVATGIGNGTLRLDVLDDDSILDEAGTPLGGAGTDNGNFTGGEVYEVFEVMTSTYISTGAEDGWILESGETTGVGGTLNIASVLRAGDTAGNKQYRAILSFDTSTLPDGAVITSVRLRFKRAGISGTNPFTTHGNLVADICQGAFSEGALLELEDFAAQCSINRVLVYNNRAVNKWHSRSLRAEYFQYINLDGLTQFRLRFGKDDNNDSGADFLKLHSGDAVEIGNRPQLVITYYVP